jgi:choline dehydrogenase
MPFFDFNYFTDPRDIVSAVALYGIMYRILTNMGLTPITPTGAPASPPANSLNPTDPTFQAIQAYVITNYSQAYHWTGSCRMAPCIEEGVVDSNGRVFGTENLYVADLTILPFNAAGNGMAPALVIGNIIADKFSKAC